ncbi:hypothetical protein HNY73_001168 [Argiope bruennichi]|uniref:Uncharacterized protein n=1 Tax=Argiope bruennichi TaxID=94029 RepID=A0A8T0G1I5_ARGBR|nr:hypothetical protein HNY73_001168 [Argiope bruennichi]
MKESRLPPIPAAHPPSPTSEGATLSAFMGIYRVGEETFLSIRVWPLRNLATLDNILVGNPMVCF